MSRPPVDFQLRTVLEQWQNSCQEGRDRSVCAFTSAMYLRLLLSHSSSIWSRLICGNGSLFLVWPSSSVCDFLTRLNRSWPHSSSCFFHLFTWIESTAWREEQSPGAV